MLVAGARLGEETEGEAHQCILFTNFREHGFSIPVSSFIRSCCGCMESNFITLIRTTFYRLPALMPFAMDVWGPSPTGGL
jgi:hypothetical protein